MEPEVRGSTIGQELAMFFVILFSFFGKMTACLKETATGL